MPLPPPEKLQELATIFKTKAPPAASFEPFSSTKAKLAKYGKQTLITAAQTGLQTAVTMISHAPTVAVQVGAGSMAIFPLGAALGPWLGALAIGMRADGIFSLHDLRESAARPPGTGYPCTCGSCNKNLTYIIDRKETNAAILAVGVFTAGLAVLVDRLNSVRKSFQKNRPKEQICTAVVQGARGGCLSAIATALMLCGEWTFKDEADKALVIEAVAAIWSSDGHLILKSKW